MGNHVDRETYRCWKVIKEIDEFILKNDKTGAFTSTRRKWYWGYILHLARLLKADQLIIKRNGKGITAICGWARVNPQDEYKINKLTWELPEEISKGENLYITVCVVNEGKVNDFRRELINKFAKEINEVFWFDVPHNRYIRRKNILKEMTEWKIAG